MNRRHTTYLRRATVGAATAAFLTGIVIGCGTPGTPTPEATDTITMGDTPSQNRPDDSYPTADDVIEPAIINLGETYTYPDGLAITVTDAGTTIAGEYPGGSPQIVPPGNPIPMFETTLTNNTGQIIDPAMVTTSLINTDNGQAVSGLYTTDTSAIFWDGLIVPGTFATHTDAYDIAPGTPATMTVSVDYDRPPLVVNINR